MLENAVPQFSLAMEIRFLEGGGSSGEEMRDNCHHSCQRTLF